jgi:hypothetical protein
VQNIDQKSLVIKFATGGAQKLELEMSFSVDMDGENFFVTIPLIGFNLLF